MAWNQALNQLRDRLAQLYPHRDSQLRLIDSILPGITVPLASSAITVWHAILEEASRHGTIPQLLSSARYDYPNDVLLAEIEQALALPETDARQQIEQGYDRLLQWSRYLSNLPADAHLTDAEAADLAQTLDTMQTDLHLLGAAQSGQLIAKSVDLHKHTVMAAINDAQATVRQHHLQEVDAALVGAIQSTVDALQALLNAFANQPSPTPLHRQSRTGDLKRVDLAVITAMSEELMPVLELTGGPGQWQRQPIDRYMHYYAEWSIGGQSCGVLACAQGNYGGDETVAAVVRVAALRPRLLAMTGICAGREEVTHLGDVIVADRAYRPEEGKQTITGFRPDIQTYQPPAWLLGRLRELAANNTWHHSIRTSRPLSLRYQAEWLLCSLARHQRPFPESDADLQEVYAARIDPFTARERLREKDWLDTDDQITDAGRAFLRELRMRRQGELIPQPDPAVPRVHYGAFASTVPIIATDQPFLTYRQHVRKVQAIELEVRSLFSTAANQGIPAFAVKGVSDYATTEKDDSFHDYAAEAAARWMHAFVTHNIDLLSD